MKYVITSIFLFALSCSANQRDMPDGDRASPMEPRTTIPAADVADVVNRLISMAGTEAKMDAIAKNTVKEFNERHASEVLVLRFGIYDLRPDGSAYKMQLTTSEIPKAFFAYRVPSMYGDREMTPAAQCFLTTCKMSLTEQEVMAIEKPKGRERATSFVEMSGTCTLVYGAIGREALTHHDTNAAPSMSTSGKVGIVGCWRVPEYSATGKSLFLVLQDVKTKVILPAR